MGLSWEAACKHIGYASKINLCWLVSVSGRAIGDQYSLPDSANDPLVFSGKPLYLSVFRFPYCFRRGTMPSWGKVSPTRARKLIITMRFVLVMLLQKVPRVCYRKKSSLLLIHPFPFCWDFPQWLIMDSNCSILKQSRAEWLPLRYIQSEKEVDRNSAQCNRISKGIL